jgi:hypothetical protein
VGLIETPQGWKFKEDFPSGPEAAYFSRGYLEVLLDFSPKIMNFRLEDQLMIFRTAAKWPKKDFIKFAKYCTAAPMAKFLQNDLPSRPEGFNGNFLWSGSIKRFLKTRIVARSPRNSRLFFGILQGVKRACMQVPEDFIVEAMIKHKKALTSAPRGKAPSEPMRSRYAEFFSAFRPRKPKLWEASTSASFESKRSEGGARGWLQSNKTYTDEELITMRATRPGRVESHHGPSLQMDLDELIERALDEPIAVQVSAVLEPLKVRLITKGNTLRYWLSRDYQKQLWGYLQRFPQFALTGRPLMAYDLHQLISREEKLGFEFPNWVSGDYAAATDTLDIRHTKAAFEASLKMGLFSLPPKYQEVLRSVLYEQDIYYPKRIVKKFPELSPDGQQTGQLMGSTLSFPILCVVNICAYWSALEEYAGREFDVQELPVLVNGDDILFRCDDRLYGIWLKHVSNVGFELSLGKNYVNPNYLTVNSELYFHDKKKRQFYRQGSLNAGLLTGQSKITGRMGVKLAPVWDYFNEIAKFSLDPERAKRRFLHYHREVIERITQKGKYNLFITPLKGGLGFTPVGEIRATAFQRRFASFMDDQLRQHPDEFHKITLIQERPDDKPRDFHNPKYIVQPKMGPYEEGVVGLRDTTWSLPPLAARLGIDIQSDLRVKHPKRETMDRFRSRNWREQRKAIFSPDRVRLMEYEGTRKLIPSGFLSTDQY